MNTQESEGKTTKSVLTTWLTIIGLASTTILGIIKCTDTGRDFYCKVANCTDSPPPPDPNYEVKRKSTFRAWEEMRSAAHFMTIAQKSTNEPFSAIKLFLRSLDNINLQEVDPSLIEHIKDEKHIFEDLLKKKDELEISASRNSQENLEKLATEFLVKMTAEAERIEQDQKHLSADLSSKYNYEFKMPD